MQHIHIIAVGRLGEPHWHAAQKEYLKRLAAYARVSVTEIQERRADTPGGIEGALAAEAKDILAAIPNRATAAVLSLKGTRMDSLSFSRAIDAVQQKGGGTLCFIIGGSHGTHSSVDKCADTRLCLSDMTMTHALARVFLLEQIYRAYTILHGKQYHK
jgi:23S rRNA (pseudouridine1915-N3)-methyltransferase